MKQEVVVLSRDLKKLTEEELKKAIDDGIAVEMPGEIRGKKCICIVRIMGSG